MCKIVEEKSGILTIFDPQQCLITINYPDIIHSYHKFDFYRDNFNKLVVEVLVLPQVKQLRA